MAQLTRLQRLNLCTHSYSSGSLSCLSAMAGSLTRLHLSSAHGPSAGLAVLTRLQHWECRINNEAATQALAGALPHLAGLTCLVRQCGLLLGLRYIKANTVHMASWPSPML